MDNYFLVPTAVLVGCVIAYLVYFIHGWIKARRIGSIERPSFFGLTGIIILIFIVWAIAAPNFLPFNATANQSEAKTNLRAIYLAQRAYFSDHNTYAGGPDAFKLINWGPTGQNRYAYYCGDQVILNMLPMGRAEIPMPSRDWPVDTKPASSKISFTCMAVGRIFMDETLDVWSINETKMLRNDPDGRGYRFFGLWKD